MPKDNDHITRVVIKSSLSCVICVCHIYLMIQSKLSRIKSHETPWGVSSSSKAAGNTSKKDHFDMQHLKKKTYRKKGEREGGGEGEKSQQLKFQSPDNNGSSCVSTV